MNDANYWFKNQQVKEPAGFCNDGQTRLSWIVESEGAKRQAAARVEVSTDDGFRNIIFDSGKRKTLTVFHTGRISRLSLGQGITGGFVYGATTEVLRKAKLPGLKHPNE